MAAQVPRPEPMILHLRGHVRMVDFLATGGLADQASPPFSSILFDWSDIISWSFQPPTKPEVRSWLVVANSIDRLAIVHHRAWKRQAAWFAALLRTGDCRVRSYHPHDYDRALDWLMDDNRGACNPGDCRS
ncbi:STAS/SEC14 domain-containing protein [Bradyrhizobium jicamae]|uniref:STAS/SEC14 domain-containing protein n=1 Tax=Bradyrhizobium jicamae TaxID=280332 RepID=UPI001BA57721|nr:STAS/SEC14 domain-containing protein [Bradyrhizobium jicamae]MBR0932503.1 STAS/SEC14 domain-containing protein [Bradyrhizobium jicamae]